MKTSKISLTIISILLTVLCFAQTAPKRYFNIGAGGASTDMSYGVSLDKDHNSYLAGYFQGIGAFGNNHNLISNGAKDAFVAKYSRRGICEWAIKIGAGGNEIARGIVTDSNGNSYIIVGRKHTNTAQNEFLAKNFRQQSYRIPRS